MAVVLLLSTLRIIMVTANLASWFPFFVLIILLVVAAIFAAVHADGQSNVSFIQSCLLASTALNQSSVSLTEPHSRSTRLFVISVLHIDCYNYSLSAKYEHVQNHSNLFECEEKCAF